MTYENYKIECDKDEVRVYGDMPIEDAIDLLLHYQTKGFCTLLHTEQEQCFRLSKIDYSKGKK